MLNSIFGAMGHFLIGLLPLIGTLILFRITWIFWLHYIQQNFISGITWVLLEVVPPREVLRSPKAMELFFTNALYHKSQKGGLEEYWQGAVWFWYSLEIVSIDGQVHFYIRCPSRLKSLIETQMYAQYPQAQVKDAEDYTLAIPEIRKGSEWNLWGCEFKLDKSEAFPIKTYVDFGLDKDPKEEYKVDPLSPVIELLSSIQKGEQLWVQIVVRPDHEKKFHTHGTWFGHHDWTEESVEVMKKMADEYTKVGERPDGTFSKEIRAPDWLKPVFESMTLKTTKLGFETGIRICYVAKREIFSENRRRDSRLIFRQYAAPNMNQFMRFNSTQGDAYPWAALFMTEKRVDQLRNRMLHEYRERGFYHLPMRHNVFSHQPWMLPWPISPAIFPNFFHHHTYILNVEELATLWHFPGQILKVPGLERVESKEASPPTNLPT
jgi:hypothetical protein